MFSKKKSKICLDNLFKVKNSPKSEDSKEFSITLNDQIDEKLKEINDLLFEYEINRLLFLNDLSNLETSISLQTTHPEIFFSAKIFKKFNVLKLLKRSSFGKVI